MTTITIERELLEQVLAVLTKSSCAVGYESETEWLNVNSKIRTVLAAPATAPAQPSNTTVPGTRCDDAGYNNCTDPLICGVMYLAKDVPGDNWCECCAGVNSGKLCDAMPYCTPGFRDDGRNIVFVRAEP